MLLFMKWHKYNHLYQLLYSLIYSAMNNVSLLCYLKLFLFRKTFVKKYKYLVIIPILVYKKTSKYLTFQKCCNTFDKNILNF